jgi:galactonate dehydratase
MKITEIETYLVGNPWKIWVFVRVLTDQGVYGVGEGTLGQMSGAVAGAIQDITPRVLGADPFDVEWIVNTVSRDVYADGGQIKMSALAAIEIACWDIMGKATKLPVYKLIGGKCHPRLRAYANGWYRIDRKPELFAERAARVKELGYTAMKFDPFGAAWRVLTPAEEDLSIDIVRHVRTAVGPDVDLMIEAHSRFGVSQAIRIARRLEEFHPAWFEEPVPHHNPLMTIEVARATSVPIATGESLSSKQAAELLQHGAVQILQIEPVHVGGILASRKIADMADAYYGVLAPHSASGAIASTACIHIDAATPNFYVQEFFHDFSDVSWEKELFIDAPKCVNGYLELPTAPGLGIDLNLDVAKAHPAVNIKEMNLWEDGWEKRRTGPKR